MKFEADSIRRFMMMATVGVLLIAISFIPTSSCVPVSAGEMEAKTGSEDTRKWNSGVGLWGKRSTPAIEDQQLLAFVDGQPHVKGGRYLHKRPEDSWNKLNSLWGKRSSNWQTATGLWGKRSSHSGGVHSERSAAANDALSNRHFPSYMMVMV